VLVIGSQGKHAGTLEARKPDARSAAGGVAVARLLARRNGSPLRVAQGAKVPVEVVAHIKMGLYFGHTRHL